MKFVNIAGPFAHDGPVHADLTHWNKALQCRYEPSISRHSKTYVTASNRLPIGRQNCWTVHCDTIHTGCTRTKQSPACYNQRIVITYPQHVTINEFLSRNLLSPPYAAGKWPGHISHYRYWTEMKQCTSSCIGTWRLSGCQRHQCLWHVTNLYSVDNINTWLALECKKSDGAQQTLPSVASRPGTSTK